MTGIEGRDYLTQIVHGLTSDPDRFRAMNPPNKWGDYDQLVHVIRQAIAAVPDWPCEWRASG